MFKLQSLINAKKNNSFSHAYLLYGDSLTDIDYWVLESIKIIWNLQNDKSINHIKDIKNPDLFVIDSKLNSFTKEELVNSIKNVSNSSLIENHKKIFLIKNIDKTLVSNLNALLKFLEDPGDNTIVLMSTNNYDKILDTIKSRAQNIFIPRINQNNSSLWDDIDSKYTYQLFSTYKNIEEIEKNKDFFIKEYEEFSKIVLDNYNNKNIMFIEFAKSLNKKNYLLYIQFLTIFFIELQKIKDLKYFPNLKKVFLYLQKKKINNYKIFNHISFFNKSLESNGNFNLQRDVLLNSISGEIGNEF